MALVGLVADYSDSETSEEESVAGVTAKLTKDAAVISSKGEEKKPRL